MENSNTNAETTATNQEGQSQSVGTQTQETKTYTEQEALEMANKEADRRVTEAMKTWQRKSEAKIAEAQKLAQMNEAEKYEYQLKQREEAIAAKERELALLENKNEASKILSEKGLSLALVEFVVAEDAETMKYNIDTLDKAFKASVKAEVEKRMSTSTPKKNLPVDKMMTKAELLSKPTIEIEEFKRNNPDIYNQLMNNN